MFIIAAFDMWNKMILRYWASRNNTGTYETIKTIQRECVHTLRSQYFSYTGK